MSDKEHTILDAPDAQQEFEQTLQLEASAETESEAPAPGQAEEPPSGSTPEPVYGQASEQASVLEQASESAIASETQNDTSVNDTSVAEQKAARSEGEEFDSMLDSYPEYTQPSTGNLLKGRVMKVTGAEAIVDVGYKSEGVIPIDEFRDARGNLKVAPGDEIEVLMESTEERDGYVTLSYAKARRISVWRDIEAAFEQQTPVIGIVTEKTKGGLAVDIGMRAFLPGSQIDIRPVRNLDALVGQEITCRIIKVNRKRGNIVVSRKALLEEEHLQRKQATIALLQEGAVLTGTVKNLTDYAAFVDLGGIDGLLHITDLSWGRIGKPSEVVSVGQQIQVKVLKFDAERERVSLGLKQLTEDPWVGVAEKYQANNRIKGKVLNVTDYGAFIELEPGIEGLVHVSEMSWSKRLRHPSKIVSRGDEVEAMILDVNPRDRRISLGLRQTEPNPWASLAERYTPGTRVQGKVRNLTDFGAFIEVEEGVDGLVHVSDLSWTQRVKHPSEVLKKGESVQAVILNVDPENRRLSLGIKQLQPDTWETYCNEHKIGDAVKGKVVRKTTFGLFIELAERLEGLCHVSEISWEPAERRAKTPEIGDELEFKIIKMTPQERKIGLSLKAMQPAPPPRPAAPRPAPPRPAAAPKPTAAPQQYSSSGPSANIGEMMAMKERNPTRN